MSTFDIFPKEIWLNILERLITLPIEFLNPKHQHVRSISAKWEHGTFKMTYPFLRMVSRDLKQLMHELRSKYFESNGSYVPLRGYDMCIAMAAEGHLSALKYLHENGAKWTEDTSNYAALHGQLDCLIYAHEHGCKWGSETCALAAWRGHFDCLKYAHDNGCAWDTECCTNAAQRGDLKMIQYLVSNGCRWSAQTTEAAAKYGHLELLQYLYERGCPHDTKTLQAALVCGNIDVLRRLDVVDPSIDYKSSLFSYAIQGGSVECFKFLIEEKGVLVTNKQNLIQTAHSRGKFEVAAYLRQLDPKYDAPNHSAFPWLPY